MDVDFSELGDALPDFDPGYLGGVPVKAADYLTYYGLHFSAQGMPVQQTIGKLQADGERIVCQYFKPRKVEATCFIQHGYLDHTGLYARFIARLLTQNIAVVIHDMPGHGLSSGDQADTDSFHHYSKALDAVVQRCKSEIPKPWVMLGQSTGGAVAMSYALSYNQGHFERTVLCAPLVYPKGWRWMRIIVPLMNIWLPSIKRTHALSSHDHKFLFFLENKDPFQAKLLPLRWLRSNFHWVRWLWRQPTNDHPVLLLQGDNDQTVDWQYNVPVIQRLFSQCHTEYLPSGRHRLINEGAGLFEKVVAYSVRYIKGEL